MYPFTHHLPRTIPKGMRVSSFHDPKQVARYAEGPLRQVPGFLAMQQMARLLLAEKVPEAGSVLAVGAGGGLELRAFAECHPEWRFCGVDPSQAMIELGQQTMAELDHRVQWHHGYVDTAPHGPFDGATCLLTLHFLPREERVRTVAEIARRLKPGAPLVVAHHSFAQQPDAKERWLRRYVAFALSQGAAIENADQTVLALGSRLPALSPEDDVKVLQEGGFTDVELFYAAFTFRGWVARRA